MKLKPPCTLYLHPVLNHAHLGDDLNTLALLAQHSTDVVQVRALAHEGRRNEVHIVGHGPLDKVLLILLRQRREVDHNTGEIDVLALAVQ